MYELLLHPFSPSGNNLSKISHVLFTIIEVNSLYLVLRHVKSRYFGGPVGSFSSGNGKRYAIPSVNYFWVFAGLDMALLNSAVKP